MATTTASATTKRADSPTHVQSVEALEPGQLRVIRRDGTAVLFDPERIAVAIKKAFLAVEGNQAAQSERIQKAAEAFTQHVSDHLRSQGPSTDTIHIETIQDLVELALMLSGEHQVARSYVLYREARRQARLKRRAEAQTPQHVDDSSRQDRIEIVRDDGKRATLDWQWLSQLVQEACTGLEEVAPTQIIEETKNNLFDGVSMQDIRQALVMSARTLVETEPNYSYVTARLLLHNLRHEAAVALGLSLEDAKQPIADFYPNCFKRFIMQGIELERLDPILNDFDLDRLSRAIQPQRDNQFTHLSLQTLYDRYFIHHKDQRIELPQVFFMRVAMGLAHCEGEVRDQRAIEFYELLSSFDFMSSTPTLFNAGTGRPQLSSCYLTTVPDALDGIYSAIRDNALLSQFAGGLANDWTPVRGMGARIKSTNGRSSGIIPFLNVVDATAIAVNQGGKRKGAICAYLESWHIDIEEFLALRKNTGDERRRTHDMNTANWVPDLLMQRIYEDKEWSLFSPDEVPDLHDLYGKAFEKAYCDYEEQAKRGEIRRRVVSAKALWRKMLTMLFETGHPWITFKDVCNLRSPQQHVGVVHSSNLCTEITLNTSLDEIAVCNLGSINLLNHMKDGKLDTKKLEKTTQTAIRMLDNVIDINYYSVPQAKRSNLRHRPIGLGLMGFQDALYEQRIPYASAEAVEFADYCMEHISYYAISASVALAEERGVYPSYSGSLWSQGILPIDSMQSVKETRRGHWEQDSRYTMDWDTLRERVKRIGLRNSNIMAIAPTATISNICGVTQSTEPVYQNLFVKSNLSGEFTIVNAYMVKDLKARGLWDAVMIHDLKYYNGSLKQIARVPDDLKKLYATAFEIEPRWLIEAASRRQKWIDQSHSLNLYLAEPSGKKLDALYRMAWTYGLKSTYYLRTLAATSSEKATIKDNTLTAIPVGVSCSTNDEECEVCQ